MRFAFCFISQNLHILNLRKAGIEEDQQRRDQQQQNAQRRAQRPVAYGAELVFDDVADVEHLSAAEHVRDGVGAESRDEGQDDGREDAREGQRQRHAQEGHRGACAEIGRRLQHRGLQLFDGGIHGQHRKRQKVCDQAKKHKSVGIDEGHRLLYKPQRQKRLVDRAVRLKQQHPSIQAHEGVCPERDHEQHNEARGHIRWLSGDVVSKGVTQQEADDGRHQRHTQALEDDVEVDKIRQRLIGFERRDIFHAAEGAAGHEADEDDKEHGNRHEQDHPYRYGSRLRDHRQTTVPFASGRTVAAHIAPPSMWMRTDFSVSHQI